MREIFELIGFLVVCCAILATFHYWGYRVGRTHEKELWTERQEDEDSHLGRS